MLNNCRTRRIPLEEMEKMIAKEIPNGSSEAQVKAFLDSRNISHSEYLPIPPYGKYDEKVKLRNDIKGYISAFMKDANAGFPENFGIGIKLYFDEHRNLIAHTIEATFE